MEDKKSEGSIHDLSIKFAKLEERVTSFVENELLHLQKDVGEIKKTVSMMANRGVRPTWSVVIIITFFVSLSVGLIVKLVG